MASETPSTSRVTAAERGNATAGYTWDASRGLYLMWALAFVVAAVVAHFGLNMTVRVLSYVLGGIGGTLLMLALFASNAILNRVSNTLQAVAHFSWLACTFWWR